MGEQDKYEREVREIQRGEMQVKESAQIYRGKTKRRDAEWGGRSGSVSMMERGRVREAVNVDENRKEGKGEEKIICSQCDTMSKEWSV